MPDQNIFKLLNSIKEDGIVLSPQRQSFGQGCHAPHSAPERGSQQDRIKSMIGRSVDRERDGRSRLTGRVGRGRSSDYLERTPLRDRNRVLGLQLIVIHEWLNTEVGKMLTYMYSIAQ